MTLLVALQARRLGEGLEAHRATVGLLLGVDSALMATKVTQTVEVKVAVGATVRSISLLNALMGFEKIKITESSQAFTTDMLGSWLFLWFLHLIMILSCTLVSFQCLQIRETLLTFSADR